MRIRKRDLDMTLARYFTYSWDEPPILTTLAEEYNLSPSSVSRITKRTYWRIGDLLQELGADNKVLLKTVEDLDAQLCAVRKAAG